MTINQEEEGEHIKKEIQKLIFKQHLIKETSALKRKYFHSYLEKKPKN